MNWVQWMIRILTVAPIVVAGIEAIHTEAKSGAVKKQMAMDALGLSAGVAQLFVPDNLKPAAQAASQLASQTIDGLVTVMNATKGQLPPAPAPTE